jgi:hypothetical protein
MSGIRILPDPSGKTNFIVIPDTSNFFPGIYPHIGIGMPMEYPYRKSSKKYRKYIDSVVVPLPPFSPISSPISSPMLSYGMPGMAGMPGMPGMAGMPGMPGMPGMAGMPGSFVVATTTSGTSTPTAPTGTASAPTVTTAAAAAAAAAKAATTTTYTVVTPPITNVRHITSPDADPELRRKVVKHFYNQLKEVYFLDKFNKLFKYIVVENDKARLVKSNEELQKNANNNNNSKLKISFITDNIFSKYDLEVLISKLIAKYSMLYSDDEYNMHWYTAKYKHAKLVKKAMYKKIKYRLQKKVKF